MNLQAKTVGASEREEEARARWREQVAELDPERRVFVDECGSHIGLAPLRVRAPKGERAFGEAPRNRGKNMTLLASMGPEGMGPCLAVEGATTKSAFETYVELVLVPSLSPGQTVVMDNLSAHKGDRGREMAEGAGCEVLFLPSYSPDFLPIEEALLEAGSSIAAMRYEVNYPENRCSAVIGFNSPPPADTRGRGPVSLLNLPGIFRTPTAECCGRERKG